MNKKINKFLLAGDKFIPEMYLRQSGFTYSACWTFAKNKERIQKLKEGRDLQYIYQNELDKCCFQHDMTYRDFKDLPRRYVIKHLILLKIENMMDIEEVLLQLFIHFLIK